MSAEYSIICITPVRNESWILHPFLSSVSLWADHIIVLDHCSTDASREIARSFPKVQLYTYDKDDFEEEERRTLLVEKAREVPVEGRRVLFALDADEGFQAAWLNAEVRDSIVNVAPGTTLKFPWANIVPGFEEYWATEPRSFGFVDDGSPFEAADIHGARLPSNDKVESATFPSMHVMHFQYVNWKRMKSKQRWYQCWEWINHPKKRAVDLFRQYHHMDTEVQHATQLPRKFWKPYAAYHIDWKELEEEDFFWWDREVLDWFEAYGTAYFRKTAIWNDVDWPELAKAAGRPGPYKRYSDPRRPWERLIHHWLRATQPRRDALDVRIIQKMLQLVGW